LVFAYCGSGVVHMGSWCWVTVCVIMKELKGEDILMQLDEFQPKSSETFQEARKGLPFCSTDAEVGHCHCKWRSLPA